VPQRNEGSAFGEGPRVGLPSPQTLIRRSYHSSHGFLKIRERTAKGAKIAKKKQES
jgi:hypothetical protein